MKIINDIEYLTSEEARKKLGVNEVNFRQNYILPNKIQYLKRGRYYFFRQEWIDEYIERNTVPANTEAGVNA